MTQRGLVIDTEGGMALVRFTRSEACANCAACGMGRQSHIKVSIPNGAGAKPGDTVEVELHAAQFAKASVVAYVFPLLAFMAGLWQGPAVLRLTGLRMGEELFSCLLALVFMAGVYAVIRLTDKRRAASGRFAPRMIAVVDTGGPRGDTTDGRG